MEIYEKPQMEILEISNTVTTTSCSIGDPTGDPNEPGMSNDW